MQKTIIITALLTLFVSCDKIKTENYRIGPGEPLPSFSIKMNDGGTVSSNDIKIGKALIVFFHTQCPDCVEELKILQPFYQKYRQEIPIILISREESKEEITSFWKENDYNMPFSAQTDRKVYELFSSRGIPLVILSSDGIIKQIWDDKDMFNEEKFLKSND